MRRKAILYCAIAALFLVGACAPKAGPTPAKQAGATCPPGVDAAALQEAEVNATLETDAADAGAENLDPELENSLPPSVSAEALTDEERRALESRPQVFFDLTEQDRKEVQQFFTYFTHTKREMFERWLERSQQYLPWVVAQLKANGLPEELAYLPFVESGYNPRAYSRAGAAGMWQFMPYTGRKYGLRYDWWVDERRDPYKATFAAMGYLSDLHGMFGDWYLALAAYNAGEGKIGRAIKALGCDNFFELTEKNDRLRYRARLRRETRHYVPKFIAVVMIMRNLEELGFKPIDWDDVREPVKVDARGGTDLTAMAKDMGTPWADFQAANTAYRRNVSPPDAVCPVYVPADKVAEAKRFFASDKSRPYAGYLSYKVRSGDSWYRISRRYDVPIEVLKKVNNRRSNILHPGQRLMIPGGGAVAQSPAERTREIAVTRGNYVVQRGDTLYAIGKATGVSVRTLMRANGLTNAKHLRVGMKLYVPDQDAASAKASTAKAEEAKKTVVYKVRKGDSVWSIARRFGVSYQDLLRWNNLSKRSVIQPGQTLTVFMQ